MFVFCIYYVCEHGQRGCETSAMIHESGGDGVVINVRSKDLPHPVAQKPSECLRVPVGLHFCQHSLSPRIVCAAPVRCSQIARERILLGDRHRFVNGNPLRKRNRAVWAQGGGGAPCMVLPN